MLIRGLTGRGGVLPAQLYIFNRTPQKTLPFKELMPEINIVDDGRKVLEDYLSCWTEFFRQPPPGKRKSAKKSAANC